jgi:glycosyltransferase involved in cell wall biosynthesis
MRYETCLYVFTHGRRQYLDETIASARENLIGPNGDAVGWRCIVDDSGDPCFTDYLVETYPDFTILPNPMNLGYSGTINRAWRLIPDEAEWVFHLEDDFTFNEPVDLRAMADTLGAHPELLQLALKRQPWSVPETEAGGVVEMWPMAYRDERDDEIETRWASHRLFWTTNPSIYSADLARQNPWPLRDRSEIRFSEHCRNLGEHYRFAYWGAKADPPKVTHIGHDRAGGKGY